MRRRVILGLCAALLPGAPAIAQTYPNKPIRLVVGYSAGGGNDLIARIVAAKLQEKLGPPRPSPTATRCWWRRAGR